MKRSVDGAWIKKEDFDAIRLMLESLKHHECLKKKEKEFFIIDNCCTWRNKIEEVFGKNTKVLLDLFHAIHAL